MGGARIWAESFPVCFLFRERRRAGLGGENGGRWLRTSGWAAEGVHAKRRFRVWSGQTSIQEVGVFTLRSENLPPGDHQWSARQPPGLLPAQRYFTHQLDLNAYSCRHIHDCVATEHPLLPCLRAHQQHVLIAQTVILFFLYLLDISSLLWSLNWCFSGHKLALLGPTPQNLTRNTHNIY